MIGLAPNEFLDHPDPIGLFNPHDAPYEFLTVEYIDKLANSPGISGIEIVLLSELYEYEREPFTFMILLAEMGGAYAIITAIPTFFISGIVEKMFMNRLA